MRRSKLAPMAAPEIQALTATNPDALWMERMGPSERWTDGPMDRWTDGADEADEAEEADWTDRTVPIQF